MEKAFLANSANWLLVFFLNLGNPILTPFLFPLRESKKFLYAVAKCLKDCCKGTEETSFSHSLSGVFLEKVNRPDSWLYVGSFSSSLQKAIASLQTTRTQPNNRSST